DSSGILAFSANNCCGRELRGVPAIGVFARFRQLALHAPRHGRADALLKEPSTLGRDRNEAQIVPGEEAEIALICGRTANKPGEGFCRLFAGGFILAGWAQSAIRATSGSSARIY